LDGRLSQAASCMKFETEEKLVDQFIGLLETNQTPWGMVRFAREFDYARGRTDVIAAESANTLLAIEAKLSDWRWALHQAYRNTCFAHRSFVLLPKLAAMRASSFLIEFERRGVGLCYIDHAGFTIVHDSPYSDPVEPWLALEALSMLRHEECGVYA